MEIVNYDNFVAIIIESKALDYDVFELKRISWLVNFLDESIIIENEDVFLKYFQIYCIILMLKPKRIHYSNKLLMI
jgi:hypothetical protein